MKTRELAEKFLALFAGYEDAHGTHGEPRREPESLKWIIKSSAETLREPVTVELWQAHLEGERPLGVMPIRPDGTCLWACIDYDQYDVNILDIIKRVNGAKLPLVPCRSKSGGLHLFLFLREPQEAALVQSVLRDVSAALGISGSEIFPKQTRMLVERGDLGSWMVMPYFGDTFGGKLQEQVGLRETGAELTAEEFLRMAAKCAVTDPSSLAPTRPPVRPAQPGEEARKEPFSDGPPCLQHMARTGIERGGQDNALFMVGLYLIRKYPADWKEKLEEYNNRHFRPPVKAEDVAAKIRSLEKKEYEYTCSVEPMASHCDARTCRRRRYGVGSMADFPDISGLSVLDADPAIWFVDVDGQRLEMSTPELQRYDRFHAVAMERLHRCYMPLKHETWTKIVAAAMQSVEVLPVSEDVTLRARFLELAEEFCTNRQSGTRREDLMVGKPWLDEEGGRHYFRLRDLEKFMEREGHKGMRRGEMTNLIKKLGGENAQLAISGHNRNVWWMPSEAFKAAAAVPIPAMPRQEI